MKNLLCIKIVVLGVLLVGCGSTPQTADAFRSAAAGSPLATVERFQVDRPFNRVAGTLETMAPKCFDFRATEIMHSSTSQRTTVTKWNPTVVVKDDRAELHVQLIYERGIANASQAPEKGQYLIVVDALPAGQSSTDIVMYRPSVGYGLLVGTVKDWVTGDRLSCPQA